MNMIVVLSLWFAAAAVFDPGAQPSTEPLLIETASGVKQAFNVEIVKEEKVRTRGLMFRQSMPKDHGMLFDYDPPQQISFWMKNTYISLDIIFIDANGVILNIAEKTTPLSLTTLPSAGPARGILEINGGLSAKLGIKAGDHVRHRIFANAAP